MANRQLCFQDKETQGSNKSAALLICYKNNKKGKLSYLWTVISIVVYVLGFGIVLYAWQENIVLGIMALLFALSIMPIAHKKAIDLAQEQRRINGKGRLALLLAILLPTAILVVGFFFFVFGYVYMI